LTEKEIAKEILLKLIDVKAICLPQSSGIETADKISADNASNVKSVCDAYKVIYETIQGLK